MATAAQIKSFIERLGKLAVNECNNRIAAGKGFVLPSVCIAQSALETGWGTAGIMTRANAFFGIKAGGSWTGAVYRADTWEVANGEAYNTTANFRAYSSLAESVTDYYNLIGNASRYSSALSFGKDKSAWKTPKACITAIWAGGYATDTLYVEKIMSTINARNLAAWDDLVTGEGSLAVDGPASIAVDKSELVPGKLIATDSNRALGIEANEDYLSTPIDKLITLNPDSTSTYAIVIPPQSALYYGVLVNTVTMSQEIVNDSDNIKTQTIVFSKGATIGFSIRLLKNFNRDFTVEFNNPNLPLISGNSVLEPLAFFVKIE